jgi:hypothetical protein
MTQKAGDVRVPTMPVEPMVEWDAAVTAAFSTSDLDAICVLLAGPPAGIPAGSLDDHRSRLWPWLLTGRTPQAAPPPTVTRQSPPPIPRDEGPQFQQVLPDPQVPGGWLGMTWKAIYRCGAERIWRRVHRFQSQDADAVMGFLRVEAVNEPGLVLISAPTTNGPGGCSRDGGETWTWLPWPGEAKPEGLVALAPMGDGRLVLSIGERNSEAIHLFIHDGAGWNDLGQAHEGWATIPLVTGGFIVDPGAERKTMRFWTTTNGWSQPPWNASEVTWPSARMGRSRSHPALLADRCALIGGTGIVWVGANGALVEDIESPQLAKRAIDGACLVADPTNPRRMWALFHGHGLWHSADGGATWRRGQDLLANLAGRGLRLRRDAAGSALIGDGWTVDDAPSNWSDPQQPATAAAHSSTSRSAQITTAMEHARARTVDARLAVADAPAVTVIEAVNEVRRDADERRGKVIEQRLIETALNGTTQERVNWVRFLLACAGDPENQEMLLKGSSVSGESPSPDIRLQGPLPISAADLATGQDPAYTLVLARIRALHAQPPTGAAGIIIANVGEAERLVRWLAACAPRDPLVSRLRGQLEVALAKAMQLASSVTANDRLRETFGNRYAERAALVAEAITRCQVTPDDQMELELLSQLACAEADNRDARTRVDGRIERLTLAARLLENAAKKPTPAAVAMDVFFLRTATAWRCVLESSENDALTTTQAVQGTFQPTMATRSLRCMNMIERLCDAINARANIPATGTSACQRRLAWRREGVRIVELIPRFSGRKLRDLHVSLANELAWDLLTLPVRTVHDPAEALRVITRAVERDGRQSPAYLDTLALAWCRTNDRVAALRTQEEAITKLGQDADRDRPTYNKRLTVYRELIANPAMALPDELFSDPTGAAGESPEATETPATPRPGANDF